ncbi:MAG: hypothetical protein K6E98_11200, partial [Lachnospiraceae bacterium]|nr:hypothetical protein [Lachnospiraceae bacterium]
MNEIGGYFELEKFSGEHYHKNAIALNCGRGCLIYLARLRHIKTIWIPDYICDCVKTVFYKRGVNVKLYHITDSFVPDYEFEIDRDDWMLINDYYGQLTDDDIEFARGFSNGNLICDETQGFFRRPCKGVDTFYSCRKWFGVSDGAYLITRDEQQLNAELQQDQSFDRMTFVLGRFERSASDFFEDAKTNNAFFDNEPPKTMSLITDNVLRAIDYDKIIKRRKENWIH